MKLSTLLLTITILLSFTTSLAQSPAQPPAPAGPTNVTKILEKAGQFTMFIRLLKNTQVADQINTQLNNSNQGMTLFAPQDNAFANLKSGTLNSLTDQQKVELIQFHVIPSFMSISQFQTVSNPLRTQAGNADSSPLNVTTGGNQVNITTGVVSTTVSNTIYSDNQLAVYQVDQVLLPNDLFGAPPPALAPKPQKGSPPTADSPDSGKDDTTAKDTSGAIMEMKHSIVMTVGIVFVFLLAL